MEKELYDEQRNSADVILIDALAPEESAMSQALYSRKPKSILFLLVQVFKKGPKSFMALYYSEYGHNSIGDCGSITLHFENVSMLAAKDIQNWALYNGQEASTRYLNFFGRIIIQPILGWLKTSYLYIAKRKLNAKGISTISKSFKEAHPEVINSTPTGKVIQEKWMGFYEKHMPVVRAYVSELNPISEDQDQGQYDKAVNARAFDIMRAFLPAGMTTLVSWHGNIRQIRDHLAIMKYSPNLEVARISETALKLLKQKYPSSFEQKVYEESENYLKNRAIETSYFFEETVPEFEIDDSNFNPKRLEKYHSLMATRPVKTELPPEVGEAGTVNVRFKIDFGSFRDAQRHRKGSYRMPLLTTKYGFHQWYLDRLPEATKQEAEALIAELVPEINTLPCDDIEKQYYIPMGFKVLADFTWPFDQCVYVAELRSGDTVHPTFRVDAQEIARWIEKVAPYAALHVNYNEDKWSYKRGKQDIVEKK